MKLKIEKLDELIKFFFENNIKYNLYKKNLIKVIKFSKKNFSILTYDQIFFLFNEIDLDDLNKIFYIIKFFKIKILKEFPFDEVILEDEIKKKTFYKTSNLGQNYNKIEKYLHKISKLLLKNIFIINKIFRANKIDSLKKFIYKIKILKSNLNFNNFFSFKYEKSNWSKLKKNQNKWKKKKIEHYNSIYSNYYFNLKKNFVLLNFLTDNIVKYKLKGNKKYRILINFLKKKKFFFEITLNMIDDLYEKLINNFEILKKIRNEIYDSVANLCDIPYIKFNYFFLKNGSDLNWIVNMINNSDFEKFYKKKYFEFIKIKTLEIKRIEKKHFTKFKSLFKIFTFIEINKVKLDIIRNNIINSKLFLVKDFAKKYYKNDLYLDIIQEGNIALIKSVNSYEIETGFNFDNFIRYNVKNKINKYIYGASRLIRLPSYVLNNIRKINKFIKEYNEKYNNDPEISQISKRLNLKKKKIKEIMNFKKTPISIDSGLKNIENEGGYSEYLKSDNCFDYEDLIFDEELRNYLENLIIKLDNNRSSNIISMRYGLNFSRKYTLEEIGRIYNISRERVRQLQNTAIKKIKEIPYNSKKLKYFFNFKKKYYNIKI